MTPMPAFEEVDISQWIDIDNLCTEEDSGCDLGSTDEPATFTCDGSGSDTVEPCGGEESASPVDSLIPHDEDAAAQQSEQTQESNVGRKPNFSVICFPSDPARPRGSKKRRDFTQERRVEVAQVRKAGACLRCRVRRISVGLCEGIKSQNIRLMC